MNVNKAKLSVDGVIIFRVVDAAIIAINGIFIFNLLIIKLDNTFIDELLLDSKYCLSLRVCKNIGNAVLLLLIHDDIGI
jgi:hypothetical protein